MLDAIAATKSEYKPAKKLMSFLIIIITIFFLYETVIAAVKRPGSLYTTDTLISLLIPIIFSVLYIPISFFFAVVCRYQIIFMRMGFKEPKDDTTLKIKHRFKTIWKSYIKHMYVGMSTDEFDKLIQQFKLQISNKLLDNQDSKEEKILYNQLKEKYFLNKIGYINKHAGIFTLLFTSVIGLTSILLKGFYYPF